MTTGVITVKVFPIDLLDVKYRREGFKISLEMGST